MNKIYSFIVIVLLINTSVFGQQISDSINLVMSEYQPENEEYTSDSQNSDLVGTIKAEMNVNELGALTYTIPIEVFKGVNSMQPNLALIYNSQSSNGMAGWGWNIAGLSTITQGGKSKHIDGITIGSQYNDTDPFYLDGQRLIKQNNTEYVTEKYSKIKITKQTSGQYSFIVQYTDGKVAMYKQLVSGQHYIAVLKDAFNNQVYYNYTVLFNTVYLSYITYGALTANSQPLYFVEFEYSNKAVPVFNYRNGTEYRSTKYLNKIKVKSPHVSINNNIYRTYTLYHDLIHQGTAERLVKVEVSNETNQKLKPLTFTYNNSNSINITKTNNDISYTTTSVKELGSVAVGDFYGGNAPHPIYELKKQDNTYILYSKHGQIDSYGHSKQYLSGKALRDNKITDNDIIIGVETDYQSNLNDRLSLKFIDLKRVPRNFKTITINLPGVTKNNEFLYTFLNRNYYKNQDGEITESPTERDKKNRKIVSGDFNNDGLVDLVIFQKGGVNISDKYYFIEIGKLHSGTQVPVTLSTNLVYPDQIHQIEFNGDGVAEFLTIKDSNLKVYKLDIASSQLNNITSANRTLINFTDKTPLIFGDFNGDGLTDFFTPKNIYNIEGSTAQAEINKMNTEQQLWYEYISTGSIFSSSTKDFTSLKLAYIAPSQRNVIKKSSNWDKFWSGKPDSYEYTEYGTSTILALDINNDGITDLVNLRKFGRAKYNQNLWNTTVNNQPSTTNDFIKFYITKQQSSGSRLYQEMPQYFQLHETISPLSLILNVADYNSLNKYNNQIVVHDALLRKEVKFNIHNDNFIEGRLQKVNNGTPVDQVIEYRQMKARNYSSTPEEEPYLLSDNNFNYPYYTHKGVSNHYLTHKIHTIYDGDIITNEYRYENAVQNLEGKGYIGFQKTYISDAYESILNNGKYRLKKFNKGLFWKINTYNPQLDNVLIESTYGSLDNSSVFNRTQNTNQKYTFGTNRYLIVSTQEKEISYLTNSTTTKNYQYDLSNGILLKEASTNFNNIGYTIEKFTYTPEFTNNDSYFYGKINSIETINGRDGEIFKTKTENFYNTNGTIYQTKKYGNNTPAITTEYTYHPFGETESETIIAPNITPQTVTYDYDATNRFLWKITTADGMVQETNFNPLGRLLSEVSPLGLTTSYQYDGWGNATEVTNYLGKKTYITKSLNPEQALGYYTLTKTTEGSGVEESVLDVFDREVLARTKGLNDQWISVQTQYDLFGKELAKSEPFLPSDPIKWNTTEYDDLNRPIKKTSYNGRVATTCYEGFKITVEDGHKKIIKWIDAMGYTIKHQDAGGTIHYKYHPNGALKETDFEGIKTKIEIDGWGNKKKLIEPSAGTYLYEYDNLNRIKKETNPKGGIKQYTYDDYGKLTSENLSSSAENTTINKTFSYDPVTNLPTTVSGTYNGKQFTYITYYDDPYYRVTGKSEITPDFLITSTNTYDQYGRIETTQKVTTVNNPTFTTTSKVKNHYDTNGHLFKQTDDQTGALIWQANASNARGEVTARVFGNGYNVATTFDSNSTMLSKMKHYKANEMLLEIDYDFNPLKGMLNSRINHTFSKNETYQYDDLDRLLQESVNNVIQKQYTYDSRGRMTSNSQVGQYNYNNQDYRLQSINFNQAGNNPAQTRGFAEISYNSFKQPNEIVLEGKDKITYEYNILQNRTAIYYGSLSATATERPNRKFYAADSSVEIVKENNTTKIITYVNGDAYTANYIKIDVIPANGQATAEKYFLHRDFQSTILAITKADAQGTVVEKRYFDAWGNLKEAIIGTTTVQPNDMGWVNGLLIDRGYTGHEHLKTVGLIHMNGRIYDPMLCRFLSPDNFVQDHENTQNYNRYGYVLNNPLIYTDPSGELAFLAAVGIGIAVGILFNGINNSINGVPFWYGAGKAGVMGGISAAVSFGIGSLATSAFSNSVNQAIFQAAMHGTFSGVMSSISGGKFLSGFASGMVSSLVSSAISGLGNSGYYLDEDYTQWSSFASRNPGLYKAVMIASGGLSGGLSSAIAGGNFWMGVRQGIITSGLNHLAHEGAKNLGDPKKDKIKPQKYDKAKEASVLLKKTADDLELVAILDEYIGKNPGMYKLIGKVTPWLTAGGDILFNGAEYLDGKISGYRFSFRTSAGIASIVVGAEVGATFGGIPGLIAGAVIGWGANQMESAWDIFIRDFSAGVNQFRNQAINSWMMNIR
jgi:RHS repeat-associated protein